MTYQLPTPKGGGFLGEKLWTCVETGSRVTLKVYLGKWIATWEVSGKNGKMIDVRNKIIEKVRWSRYWLDYFFSCVTRLGVKECRRASRSYANGMMELWHRTHKRD